MAASMSPMAIENYVGGSGSIPTGMPTGSGINPMQLMSMFGGIGGGSGQQQKDSGLMQMAKSIFQPDTQKYDAANYGDLIKSALMGRKQEIGLGV